MSVIKEKFKKIINSYIKIEKRELIKSWIGDWIFEYQKKLRNPFMLFTKAYYSNLQISIVPNLPV